MPKVLSFVAYLERCHGCVKNSTRVAVSHFDTTNESAFTSVNQPKAEARRNYAIMDAEKTGFVNGILTNIWNKKGRSPFLYHKYRQNTIRIESF